MDIPAAAQKLCKSGLNFFFVFFLNFSSRSTLDIFGLKRKRDLILIFSSSTHTYVYGLCLQSALEVEKTPIFSQNKNFIYCSSFSGVKGLVKLEFMYEGPTNNVGSKKAATGIIFVLF